MNLEHFYFSNMLAHLFQPPSVHYAELLFLTFSQDDNYACIQPRQLFRLQLNISQAVQMT
eukprot:c43944_g1_i1 orf=20-199(-)